MSRPLSHNGSVKEADEFGLWKVHPNGMWDIAYYSNLISIHSDVEIRIRSNCARQYFEKANCVEMQSKRKSCIFITWYIVYR